MHRRPGGRAPTLIAADGSLMSETLYGLLIVSALLLAYRLRARPPSARPWCWG